MSPKRNRNSRKNRFTKVRKALENNKYLALLTVLLFIASTVHIPHIVSLLLLEGTEFQNVVYSSIPWLMLLIEVPFVVWLERNFELHKSVGNLRTLVKVSIFSLAVAMAYSYVSAPCYRAYVADSNELLVNIAYYEGSTEISDVLNTWAARLQMEIAESLKEEQVQVRQLAESSRVHSEDRAAAINECSRAILTLWWGESASDLIQVNYVHTEIRWRDSYSLTDELITEEPNYQLVIPRFSYVRRSPIPQLDRSLPQVVAPKTYSLFVASGGDTEYITAVITAYSLINDDPWKAIQLLTNAITYAENQSERAIADLELSAVYGYRAIAFSNLNLLDLAWEDVEKQLALEETAAGYMTKGVVLAHMGRQAEALNAFNRAVALDPYSVYALMFRARWYIRNEMPELAVDDLNKAISFAPESADLYLLRSAAFVSMRDFLPALRDADKCVELSLRYEEGVGIAYLLRGKVYSEMGASINAVADYSNAIEIRPDYASAYLDRGNYWLAFGMGDRALSDFQELLRLDPGNPGGYVGQGIIYRSKDSSITSSVNNFSHALKLDPAFCDAYFHRSISYHILAEWENMISDATSAFECDPSNEDALYLRSVAYTKVGRWNEALTDANTYLAGTPRIAYAYIIRARIYSDGLNMHAEALADIEKYESLGIILDEEHSDMKRAVQSKIK